MSEIISAGSPGASVLKDVYDKMYDEEELYQSYLEARKCKRFRGDVMLFTDRLEENLLSIQNDLIYGTYKVGAYRRFYVREPKLRLVMALPFRDRIVQWAIYRQMYPFYERLYIEDSYACRKGKGTQMAADRLQYWLRQVSRRPGEWYYLKLDISKYFYRVDHEILMKILAERIKDERLLQLLSLIINSEDERFGLPAGYNPQDCDDDRWLDTVGMPIGNLTSQLFANIYLNELDQFCKHELKLHFYERYQDDVQILSDDKTELNRTKKIIGDFLSDRLRLDLNKKTAIRPISEGIDFVGYRIWETHRKLKRSTARRMIRNTKRLCSEIAQGFTDPEELWRTAASYNGILKYCDSNGLREKLKAIYDEFAYGQGGDNNYGFEGNFDWERRSACSPNDAPASFQTEHQSVELDRKIP